jgi:peptide/nickel transport system permease protein
MFFSLLTILAIVTLVFILIRTLGPIDPAAVILPMDATAEDQNIVRQHFGLDRSLLEQYVLFLKHAVHGEFGVSFFFHESAFWLVLRHIPATLRLTLSALLVGLIGGMTIGILSAVYRQSLFDRIGRAICVAGMAVPPFVLALFMILILGVSLRWLPVSGQEGISSYLMPVLSMSVFGLAAYTRLSRSAMIEALNSECIVLARLKGVPELKIILVHALKRCCITIVTFFGVTVPSLLTGNIAIETIFSWPGIGNLAITSIVAMDYPVIQVIVLLLSFFVVTVNLLVDIAYAYINPRIRFT